MFVSLFKQVTRLYNKIPCILLCITWIARIKYHWLSGLNNRNLFSHSSGVWSSRLGCQHGQLVPGKDPHSGSQTAAFLLCAHMAERDFLPFLERPQSYWIRAPTLMIPFNCNYILKTLSPDVVTLWFWASKYKLEVGRRQHNLVHSNPLYNFYE